jgi:hypothetical protein
MERKGVDVTESMSYAKAGVSIDVTDAVKREMAQETLTAAIRAC